MLFLPEYGDDGGTGGRRLGKDVLLRLSHSEKGATEAARRGKVVEDHGGMPRIRERRGDAVANAGELPSGEDDVATAQKIGKGSGTCAGSR